MDKLITIERGPNYAQHVDFPTPRSTVKFPFFTALWGISHSCFDDSHLSRGGHSQGRLTATCHLPDVQPVQCLYHFRLQLSIGVSMTKLSYILNKALNKMYILIIKMYIYVCIFLFTNRCYKVKNICTYAQSHITGT